MHRGLSGHLDHWWQIPLELGEPMDVPGRILVIGDEESSDHALVHVLVQAGFDCRGTSTENSIAIRLTSEPDSAVSFGLFRLLTINEILVTISRALQATFEPAEAEQPMLEKTVFEERPFEKRLFEQPVFEAPVHLQSGPDLSRRELQVLRLMAAGLANKAIAECLFVSLHTARNHVKSILRKLGAHSRLEAVAIAVHGGYTERDRADGTELAS